LVIIEAPWDVTVSYHDGTSLGPNAIREASYQVDLFLNSIPESWKLGISMHDAPLHIEEENKLFRKQATELIQRIEKGEKITTDDKSLTAINKACENFNGYIKSSAKKYLDEGKIVAVLGGDHSTSLGYIHALADVYDRFAILQSMLMPT
jgi:agmatinase